MISFLYTPYELAIIINFYNMDTERYINLLRDIHRNDNIFIQPEYRQDCKKFILAVMDKLHYLNNTDSYISEQSYIEKDMDELGLENSSSSDDNEYYCSHLIFKELRIRIQYINKKGFAKMKLRTLLSELGYQRRVANVLDYIDDCMMFYHIEPTYRGNEPCNIYTADKDDTIVFRVV